jgi:hypothetical protein
VRLGIVDIACDPRGTYIGVDRDGTLWYYRPDLGIWLTMVVQEELCSLKSEGPERSRMLG